MAILFKFGESTVHSFIGVFAMEGIGIADFVSSGRSYLDLWMSFDSLYVVLGKLVN